jgi:hypothetical protein
MLPKEKMLSLVELLIWGDSTSKFPALMFALLKLCTGSPGSAVLNDDRAV